MLVMGSPELSGEIPCKVTYYIPFYIMYQVPYCAARQVTLLWGYVHFHFSYLQLKNIIFILYKNILIYLKSGWIHFQY